MVRGDPIAWGGPLAAQRRERLVRDVWQIGPRPLGQLLYAAAAIGGPATIADIDHELARIAEQADLYRRLGAGDWPDLVLRSVGGVR